MYCLVAVTMEELNKVNFAFKQSSLYWTTLVGERGGKLKQGLVLCQSIQVIAYCKALRMKTQTDPKLDDDQISVQCNHVIELLAIIPKVILA